MSESGDSWSWDPQRGLVPPGQTAEVAPALVLPAPVVTTAPAARRARRGRHAAAISRRRRVARRAGAAGTAVCLVVGGVVTTLPSASAAGPERVLQTVSVDLGTDGAVIAVRTTDISRDVHSAISSSTRTLDPASAVPDLPVVVSVAYLLDGKPGTDLAKLKGAKGLVELDVTVTNATGHSQPFSVDAGSQHSDTDALVTVPLTVVATAGLAKGSAASLVTATGGADAPHTTNGVLVDGADGQPKVQWAAVLAPPRLDGSSTFSLVEQTDSFSLPDLSLSVQPGLTADPSVEQLLSKAFGQQSPLTTLQNTTAQLTDEVSKELTSVSGLLHTISAALVASSTAAGQETDNLKGTAKDAGTELDALVGSLGSLGDRVRGQLESARSTGDQSLATSLQTLLTYIGVSDDPAAPAPTTAAASTTAGCSTPAGSDRPAATLFAQLQRIAGVLQQTAVASGGCIDATRAALTAALGGTQTCPTAPPAGTALPLTCELDAARASLSTLTSQLVSRAQTALTDLGATGLSQIGPDIATAQSAVVALQTDATALLTSAGPLGSLITALQSLQTQITALRAQTSGKADTGLGADLNALHATAVAQRDAVGPDGDPSTAGSLSGQLKSIEAGICTLPSVPAEATAAVASYAAALRNRLDHKDCTGAAVSPAAADPSALSAITSTDHAAWSKVATLTDTGAADLSGAAADLRALDDGLATAASTLGSTLTSLPVPGAQALPTSFAAALNQVITETKALYDPSLGTDPCPTTASDGPPLNRLQTTFQLVTCRQQAVSGELSSLVTSTPETLAALDTTLKGASGQGAAAQRSADTALATLLGTLSTGFSSTASNEVAQGKAALATQNGVLKKVVSDSAGQLDKNVAASIATLRSSLSQSTEGLSGVKGTLTKGIATVLGQLGTPTTGGLLGRIQDQGHDVESQGVDAVQSVGDTATGFTAAQGAGSIAEALVQQQVDQGLAQVTALPHLGPALPQGSSSTSVFTFHLAGR